ncbi:hypothetical protein RKD46_002610 [Streptomyces pseudovenezuelae]
MKKTCASRIAHTVVSSRTPHHSSSSPPRPTSARKAVPTTTVGSTKGTVTTARRSCLPGKSKRAKTYAPGSAIRSVSAVEASACQVVNHSTCRMSGWARTSVIRPNCQVPPALSPRVTIAATG